MKALIRCVTGSLLVMGLWPATLLAEKLDAIALLAELGEQGRFEQDAARDQGRRPAEVLAFLGIEPGMKVMDVIAAGGYYTEVLSRAVGSNGTVYAQNPPEVLKFRGGANDKQLTARLNGRLSNVVRIDREIEAAGLQPSSLDAAITALNLHDVYNNSPDAALGLLRTIHGLLKPGGVLGVIDHRGEEGADNAALHRMPEDDAVALAKKAGFIVFRSNLLARQDDDRSKMVFAPGVRGQTDRFLLRLVKQ